MKRNNKLNKANYYRLSQEILRNKALKNGVNLISPETIFLSKEILRDFKKLYPVFSSFSVKLITFVFL